MARDGIRDGAAAWEDVYRRARPTLVRALAVATGTYEHVEDAIQDAFAEAMVKGPPDLRSPEAWLYAVALNRLRRHHGRRALFGRLRFAAPSRPTDLDQALLRADLVHALLAVPREDRELLVAKHYVGMTQDQIAEHLNVPRGTISARLSRAAARVREAEERR